MRRFAITDIHGCKKTLVALLKQLAPTPADTLYFLGDYVDRGPDSKGVIDLIWALQQSGVPTICLRGNHEELVLRAASGNFTFLEKWLLTDGKVTMDSFGVGSCAEIPIEYLTWMQQLPYYHVLPDYILVHAGLDFTLADPLADTTEMCWLRHWHDQIRYDWLGERIILHGHTPVGPSVMQQQLEQLSEKKFLDLDGGCVYADPMHWRSPDLGFLTAFDLDRRQLIFQPNVEHGLPEFEYSAM